MSYTFSLQCATLTTPGPRPTSEARVSLVTYVEAYDQSTGRTYRHSRNFFVDRTVMSTFIAGDVCIRQNEALLAEDFLQKVKRLYNIGEWRGPAASPVYWKEM